MGHKEIEVIKKILTELHPQRCLEWGSGYSTLYFPKFLTENAKWISIEHSREWANRIKRMNRNSGVEVFYVPPNHYPWSDVNQDGSYSDLKDYIEFPRKFGNFDFILVDGRARKDCLTVAYDIISDGGVVILHDAERKYYHEPFKLYKYQRLFPGGQKGIRDLWIGSKKLNIKKLSIY